MLNPPIIESKLPAFQIPNSGNIILKIPYIMNRTVGSADFDCFKLLIKTVSTGKQLFDTPITSTSYDDNTITFNISDKTKFKVNQFYKIQVAYSKTNDSSWLWSGAGVIKCTDTATVNIIGLNKNENNNSLFTYEGLYENNDSNEKVYNYYFTIYDDKNKEYETSGILIHNASNDNKSTSSRDKWSPIKSLTSGKQYTIVYGVKTVNGLELVTTEYIISDGYSISPPDWCNVKLDAILHRDEGYIELCLNSDTTLTGKFILSRSSSKDNFQIWNTITKVDVASYPAPLTIWNDFTIEQGVEYLYSIRLYNDNNIKTVHMINNDYKILADFEDMFLFDGERQLRIRFNPKVNSFKTTLLESKMDTIGGNYPYFFRNGNIAYKEFPISGLVSLLSDENKFFMNGIKTKIDDSYYQIRTELTAENFSDERNFKLQVLNWLNNGKPKIFKSPGEGNYIVRLMNVSLSPNDTLSRMIHSFNCTAYECMDYSFTNLKEQKYLSVEDYQNYLYRHVTTKLNHIDTVQTGILLNPVTQVITGQDNRIMHNIVITNAVPLAEHFKDQSGRVYSADIEGTVYIPEASAITVLDKIELQLITLDFDYNLNFNDSIPQWDSWNNLTTIRINQNNQIYDIYNNKLYVTKNNGQTVMTDLLRYNDPNNGYLKLYSNFDSPKYLIDYLRYLKDTYSEVGEVSYLRIYDRKNDRNFNDNELNCLDYSIYVKSYNEDVQYVKLPDNSYVYRNLGILSELKCGNGYSVDIIFLHKTVS